MRIVNPRPSWMTDQEFLDYMEYRRTHFDPSLPNTSFICRRGHDGRLEFVPVKDVPTRGGLSA